MCRFRCSPRLKHLPHSSTLHTYTRAAFCTPSAFTATGLGVSFTAVVGTLRPRLFFVRLGTGTGGAVLVRGPRRSVWEAEVYVSRNVYWLGAVYRAYADP